MAGLIYRNSVTNSDPSNADSFKAKSASAENDEALRMAPVEEDTLKSCRIQSEESRADGNPPLYSSRIMGVYLEYLQKHYPEIEIDSILLAAGISRHGVDDPGHWFTQMDVDRFHDVIVARTDNEDIARAAGRFAMSTERIGAAKQYALGLISMASIYLMIGKLAKSMTRGAEMDSRKLGANKVEIISRPTPGGKEKPYQCQNRLGTIESVGKFFTRKFARVEHPTCFHKGGDCCRYIVTWEKTPAFTWKRVRDVLLLGSLTALLVFFPLLELEFWLALVLVNMFLFLIVFLHSERLEKNELVKTIETQGNAAKDLLDEMNIRHSNALLIQETGQAISKILDADRIIDTVAQVMKKHLFFDRGLIMLAEPEK